LECHACQGGCIGGNLTVENLYVARAKYLHLIANKPKPSAEFEAEVARRYISEDFYLRASLKPRPIEGGSADIRERVLRRKRAEELLRGLPLLNCGLCGAPSCRNHAEDVSAGRAELRECVFLSRERIEFLRSIYKKESKPLQD
jgi:hypothetical protein